MKQASSSQNIDDLIQRIESFVKNRCSLLDEDRQLLDEVVIMLRQHKRKWDKGDLTNVLLIAKVAESLWRLLKS